MRRDYGRWPRLPGVARGNRRTRARSRDRDSVLDALSIAFSESQISSEERERRVTSALGSRGLYELGGLVSDLQLPPDHPAAELTRAPEPATPRPAGGRTGGGRPDGSRRNALLAGGVGLAAVAALVVLVESGSDAEETRPLTAEGFARFVDDYRDEFGTTEVLHAEVMEEYISVRVPVEGGAGRWRFYNYDEDGFSPNSGGTAPEGTATVDLADVDVDRLVENQGTALDTLGVEEPEIGRVVIADDFDAGLYRAVSGLDFEVPVPPHVQIFVTNEFTEQGSLATDLAGTEVLQENPFTPAP